MRELTCIVCPIGCKLRATVEGKEVLEIEGNTCKRGLAYGIDELRAPKRTVTSTVRVDGGFLPLVPVRTEAPVPKEKIGEIMRQLATVRVPAPVAIHQVILANAAGTGVNVVASRDMEARDDLS
ncbi:MAG: DUF1667 domain-containing protein [Firmicutes bacterium]|nr:DUF1667 domain-containing protein [Bacillota bacterium]